VKYNYWGFSPLHTTKAYQFTSTEQKAPDDKTLRKLIQNFDSLTSSWNLDTAPWFSENLWTPVQYTYKQIKMDTDL